MTDFSIFLSNFAPWNLIHTSNIKKKNKNNEEENSVQSRLSRHVAELW